jgi:two-component system nitrogen regulation response regulator GlnG
MVPSVLVGRSAAMQAVFREVAFVAGSDLSVLITGETGTGKELVAMAIHQHSLRKDGVYTPIAPVTLNPDLIESELFGHAKGSFTGATEDKIGLFEKTEGGTLLLDEIGELPLSIQAKMLRVLEHGEFFRVGESRPRKCNVRIIAATNRDLREAVRSGRFREDLYYRLNGMHIHLPPLRERSEDIGFLCQHFLRLLGYPNYENAIGDVLLNQLKNRPWYGNVRELRNAIEHAAIVARGRSLCIEDFPPSENLQITVELNDDVMLQQVTERLLKKLVQTELGDKGLQAQFLEKVEPTLLRFALMQCGGNRLKAAELLGIHRSTLRERLKLYGIEGD